jgi:hypothetical protein
MHPFARLLITLLILLKGQRATERETDCFSPLSSRTYAKAVEVRSLAPNLVALTGPEPIKVRRIGVWGQTRKSYLKRCCVGQIVLPIGWQVPHKKALALVKFFLS